MDYKALEALLANIHCEMLENMLNDLQDAEKRTPALCTALIPFLSSSLIMAL